MTAGASYYAEITILAALFILCYSITSDNQQKAFFTTPALSLRIRSGWAGGFPGAEILFRGLGRTSGNPDWWPVSRTLGTQRNPESRPSWLARLLRVVPQMGSTSEPPRIKVALSHVEEAVRLLRELAREIGHEPTRECCRVHRLLAAWSWLVKDRRRMLEWRREDEAAVERERERTRPPSDDEIDAARAAAGLPPLVRAGRVVIRETVYARRRKKGGAT